MRVPVRFNVSLTLVVQDFGYNRKEKTKEREVLQSKHGVLYRRVSGDVILAKWVYVQVL